MKGTVHILLFTLLLAVISGCNARKKSLSEINTLQMSMDSMMANGTNNMSPEQKLRANELTTAYMDFVQQYPEDTLSPQFLFESARLKLMIPDYPAALEILNTIPEKYPENELAATAITTAAAICENILKDCKRAAEYLQQLKEKYPEHPTAVNIDLQIQYVCDPEGYLDAVTGNTNKQDSLFMEGKSDTLQ